MDEAAARTDKVAARTDEVAVWTDEVATRTDEIAAKMDKVAARRGRRIGRSHQYQARTRINQKLTSPVHARACTASQSLVSAHRKRPQAPGLEDLAQISVFAMKSKTYLVIPHATACHTACWLPDWS